MDAQSTNPTRLGVSDDAMKINVTATDIKRGEPLCSDNCPIARAIKRKLRKPVDVNVNGPVMVGMVGRCENVKVIGRLPPEARKFADDFDLGNLVEPFKFDLEILD